MVLLGEIDLDKEDELPLRQVAVDEILLAQREEIEARQKKEKLKNKLLYDQGFSVDFTETDLY
ncbi:7549_t:CDS:2 [Entrophospora sp. SA101]|nr:7549_t:CDS:2 [Entrophospora sp. SA101]